MKLHGGPSGLKCRRVTVAETVVIPPHSQTDIPVRAPHHRLTGPLYDVLVDSRQLRPGLQTARTLSSGRAARFPVRVLNVSNEPQEIREGELIGTLEAVDSVTENLQEEVNQHQSTEQAKSVIMKLVSGSSSELSEDQRRQVFNLLWKYRSAISMNDYDLGYTYLVSHSVDTGDYPRFTSLSDSTQGPIWKS